MPARGCGTKPRSASFLQFTAWSFRNVPCSLRSDRFQGGAGCASAWRAKSCVPADRLMSRLGGDGAGGAGARMDETVVVLEIVTLVSGTVLAPRRPGKQGAPALASAPFYCLATTPSPKAAPTSPGHDSSLKAPPSALDVRATSQPFTGLRELELLGMTDQRGWVTCPRSQARQ